MSRRLDIGIASYGNPAALEKTVRSIQNRSRTDWRLFIIDNLHPDPSARELSAQLAGEDERIKISWATDNWGYSGAVNQLFNLGETEYLAYCDNDIEINTDGWDEKLCGYLDRFHEIGMVFPNGGAAPIARGSYTEIMWGVGFCWAINRMAIKATGLFDQDIGHQNECDYAMRLRMAGYRCAAATDVDVSHLATATSDLASIERINAGVMQFVNKWNRYFNGANFNYHSPNVTRWDDWPPNALYLEEYYRQFLGTEFNANAEPVIINGQQMDLIRVPRYKDMYKARIV